MGSQNNIISNRLSEALVSLNKTYFDCEKETVLLLRKGANLEKFLEELSDAFGEVEDKVSRLIAASATFNAQKMAENQCNPQNYFKNVCKGGIDLLPLQI